MAFSIGRRLLGRSGAPPPTPARAVRRPRVGPGVTYAIGDVHGRAVLLQTLLERIREAEAEAETPATELTVVLLGDFIDRGPQSAEALDALIDLMHAKWCQVVTLKGNHEELMLRFLGGGEIGPEWAKLGGSATLKSYGVQPPPSGASRHDWREAQIAFAAAVPQAHRDLLAALALYHVSGDYLFVHAGVKPDVPIEQQSERDLLWIRGEFTRCEKPVDKVVVYGHTPSASPVIEDWKIGLDTGAYASGLLTSLRLQGTDQRILQASERFQ